MKTEYSNAEKVSDAFLKKMCLEFRRRVEKYPKSLMEEFFKRLDELFNADADNYEKLKSVIRLEGEFDEYLQSREYVLKIFEEDIKEKLICREIYSGVHKNEICEKVPVVYWLDYIEEMCFVKDTIVKPNTSTKFPTIDNLFKIDKIFEKATEYFNRNYFGGEKFTFERAAKKLADEDNDKIRTDVDNFYRKSFWEIFKKHEQIKFSSDFFDEKEKRERLISIAKIAIEAYIEVEEFESKNQIANRFKNLILQKTSTDDELYQLASNDEFWNLLCGFDDFYQESIKISESDAAISTVVLEKVTEVNELLEQKNLYGLDLRGLDLSKVDFNGATIVNCNFQDTNANLDFSTINIRTELCYIQGKKFDRLDLTNCCFKGCQVTGLSFEKISQFRFSYQTFDEEVLRKCGVFFEGIGNEMKDRYYRKVNLTQNQIGILVEVLGVERAKSTDLTIRTVIPFTWIMDLKKFFPENNIFMED